MSVFFLFTGNDTENNKIYFGNRYIIDISRMEMYYISVKDIFCKDIKRSISSNRNTKKEREYMTKNKIRKNTAIVTTALAAVSLVSCEVLGNTKTTLPGNTQSVLVERAVISAPKTEHTVPIDDSAVQSINEEGVPLAAPSIASIDNSITAQAIIDAAASPSLTLQESSENVSSNEDTSIGEASETASPEEDIPSEDIVTSESPSDPARPVLPSPVIPDDGETDIPVTDPVIVPIEEETGGSAAELPDIIAPVISAHNIFTYFGEEPDFSSITADDERNGTVRVSIIGSCDIHTPGTYPFIVIAVGAAGNESRASFDVTVSEDIIGNAKKTADIRVADAKSALDTAAENLDKARAELLSAAEAYANISAYAEKADADLAEATDMLDKAAEIVTRKEQALKEAQDAYDYILAHDGETPAYTEAKTAFDDAAEKLVKAREDLAGAYETYERLAEIVKTADNALIEKTGVLDTLSQPPGTEVSGLRKP